MNDKNINNVITSSYGRYAGNFRKVIKLIYLSSFLLFAVMQNVQAESKVSIKPVGDDRCLSKISGGFGLESCNDSNQVNMTLSGETKIAFGDGICISVPIVGGQGKNPWVDGTRLKKTSCSVPEASSILWIRENEKIIAIKDGENSSFCLTIKAGPGSLRATLLSCNDSHQLTRWTFN